MASNRGWVRRKKIKRINEFRIYMGLVEKSRKASGLKLCRKKSEAYYDTGIPLKPGARGVFSSLS